MTKKTKTITLFVALLALVLFCGCPVTTDKEAPDASGNFKEASLGLLFEVDGVKVYRFIDYGNPCYLAIDREGRASITTH